MNNHPQERLNLPAHWLSGWLMLFAIAFLFDLFLIISGNSQFRFISKPLLLISLGGWFFRHAGAMGSYFRLPMAAAIFFSWMGDTLLMFEYRSPDFFMGGLGAFLLAHLFYILLFNRIRITEKIRFRFIWILPLALYIFLLLRLFFDSLGDLKLPVFIYGCTIAVMLWMAIQLLYSYTGIAGRLIFTGALLFLISDSLLAIGKFYRVIPGNAWLVMLSYGFAQLGIIYGVLRYGLFKTREGLTN